MEHICPIYFDFDAPIDKKKKISEAEIEKALTIAAKDVHKLVKYLTTTIEIPIEYIHIFFSGQKGFHVYIDPEIFDMKPNEKLTYVVKYAAETVGQILDLKTLDPSVYSLPRMWRLNNSLHHKTGKYKIEIYYDELQDPKAILELATAPREPLYLEDDIEPRPIAEAKQWWRDYLYEYNNLIQVEELKPLVPLTTAKDDPICVKDLITNGLRLSGSRNKATLVLATYYKDKGMSSDVANKKISDFLIEQYKGHPELFLSQHTQKDIMARTRSVVNTVYKNQDKYHFLCSYIRSLGTGEHPIACEYDNCPLLKTMNQTPAEIAELHLSQVSDAIYAGSKISTKVNVQGKSNDTLVIPKKFRIECNLKKEDEWCATCPVHKGHDEFNVSGQDRKLLDMIYINDQGLRRVIQEHAGIP